VDNNSHPHFEPSSDVLTDHAKISLRLLTDIAINLPNPITLTGHTTPDESQDIGGWELSVDRANAIRRGLHRNGMPELRFDTVIGVGDSDPQIPENPNSSQNRRMTIVLLRRAPPP
jgi:chemotaxis protein MotB